MPSHPLRAQTSVDAFDPIAEPIEGDRAAAGQAALRLGTDTVIKIWFAMCTD